MLPRKPVQLFWLGHIPLPALPLFVRQLEQFGKHHGDAGGYLRFAFPGEDLRLEGICKTAGTMSRYIFHRLGKKSAPRGAKDSSLSKGALQKSFRDEYCSMCSL